VDKLFLNELRVEAIIGFWEWERRVKQIVSIDLEVATDSRAAARVDSVEGALNYERLSQRVLEFVGSSEFKLSRRSRRRSRRSPSRNSVRRGPRCRSRSPVRSRAHATSAS
jgi:hypothetical protein